MAAPVSSLQNTPPVSLEDLCRRMVMCNLRGSLQPFGDESLAGEGALDRLETLVFRRWLPTFADRGDVKRLNQLAGQIKKFFDGRDSAERVDALARKILGVGAASRIPAFAMDAEARFQLLYSMHPVPSTIQDKMKRCQMIQSLLLKESEFYGSKAVAQSIETEAFRIESEIQGEHVQKVSQKKCALYALDFSLPEGADFEDFCFVLHLRLIQESIDLMTAASRRKAVGGSDERTRICLRRQTACGRASDLIVELSESTRFPDNAINFSRFGSVAVPVTVMEDSPGLSGKEAVELYLENRESQADLYRRARQEWNGLAAKSKQNPFKFSTHLFPNPRFRILPEELPALKPDPNRIDEILSELLPLPQRAEPVLPKEKKKKPKAPPAPRPKAAAAAPRKIDPLEAEEKRIESPLKALAYAPRVERWFAAPPYDSLNPGEFPEYAGMAESPLRVICYHAFPVEVDAFLDDALQQVWVNTATGHPDEQYLLPAELELPGEEPARGVISYAIGADGVCYHRYFHPMDSRELIEKFGLRRFERSDFPELSSETQRRNGKGCSSQPAPGRIIEENPALGTVSIRDERTGAIIRIFRGN